MYVWSLKHDFNTHCSGKKCNTLLYQYFLSIFNSDLIAIQVLSKQLKMPVGKEFITKCFHKEIHFLSFFRRVAVFICLLPYWKCIRGFWTLEKTAVTALSLWRGHERKKGIVSRSHLCALPPTGRNPSRFLCGYCVPEQLSYLHTSSKIARFPH